MKQTAVEWLVEQMRLRKEQGLTLSLYDLEMFAEQAKAMEKEQIKDAYENGLYDGDGRNRSHYNMNAEYYYNETFKSE